MSAKKGVNFHFLHPAPRADTVIQRGIGMAYSIMVTIAIASFFNELFQLQMHIVIILLLTILFTCLVMIFDLNKKSVLCYFILAGIMITGALISLMLDIKSIALIKKAYEWCLSYDREKENYIRWCGLSVMAVIVLLCCIITYVLHRNRIAKYGFAVLLPVLLLVSSRNDIFVPKVSVGVVICYSLTILIEVCGIFFYKSNHSVDNSIAAIYLIPICVMISLVSVLLPSHTEPIQWSGVKNIIHRVDEQISEWMIDLSYLFDKTGSEFSVSIAGYSEDIDELGGDINIDNKTSLLVTTYNKSTSTGYLIGSIRNCYTGRNWENGITDNNIQTEDYYLDFYALIFALTKGQQEGYDLSNLIAQRYLKIEYKDIKTRTLFFPLKSYRLNLIQPSDYNETQQGAILYDKARGAGNKYETVYYEMNLNNTVLQNMLRETDTTDYKVNQEELIKVAATVFKERDLELFDDFNRIKEELINRASSITDNYTSLPDTLPDRVKKLAYELTKDCDNDYDKLKALEAYLNSLTYTTKIGKTPKGEDFVDYFLFEQQKGYCTYFASAMAVLGRCIGIPTRYVEGYVIDYKEKVDTNTYKVLSKNAHAWVDAYIEGFGWIPFEPTPAYYNGRYITWKDVTTHKQVSSSNNYNTPGSQNYVDYEELINDLKDETGRIPDKGMNIQILFTIIGSLISIMVLFLAIFTAYYFIIRNRYHKKFKEASSYRKLTIVFTKIIQYLELDGYKLLPGDTLLNYANNIGDKMKYNQISFYDVSQIFMQVRYGEKEVKEEDIHAIIQFCNQLEKYLIEKLGKRKMFFYSFLYLHLKQ